MKRELVNEIAALERRSTITPRQIWKFAKDNPDSELHKEFEWDVQAAAEKHWDHTAQRLLGQYKTVIIVEDIEYTPRKYWPDPTVDESRYRSVEAIKGNNRRAVMLPNLRQSLKMLENLEQLANVWDYQAVADLFANMIRIGRRAELEIQGKATKQITEDKSKRPTVEG